MPDSKEIVPTRDEKVCIHEFVTTPWGGPRDNGVFVYKCVLCGIRE